MKKINLIGKRFGKLTVINEAEKYNYKQGISWECKCDCGIITTVRSYCLTSNRTNSCGCLRKESLRVISTKHGLSDKTPLFSIWSKIKERCLNGRSKSYKDYGGRGITICNEWKNNFKLFYDWANNNGYAPHLTIDRINVNGNYEPSNCRWATMKEQHRNRRNNRIVDYNGIKKPLAEWCDTLNISYNTTHQRIHKYGWSIEKAFKNI